MGMDEQSLGAFVADQLAYIELRAEHYQQATLHVGAMATDVSLLRLHCNTLLEEVARLEEENFAMRVDFGKVTGSIAGVGSVFTEGEALRQIDLLPSVQEAWERFLGKDVEDGDVC